MCWSIGDYVIQGISDDTNDEQIVWLRVSVPRYGAIQVVEV